MTIWQKQYRRMWVRTALSIALFSVCMVAGVVGVLLKIQPLTYWLPIPVVVAILVTPRETVPRGLTPSNEDEREIHVRLMRLKLWLSSLRFGYLLATIVVLFGLPRLVFS